MSNSVVKVTDSTNLNDSLLLLVGEDGTITPDKNTVKTFLNSQRNTTNIQIMQINKSDGQTIDMSVDNVTYIPDSEGMAEDVIVNTSSVDQVAINLYNIKLDHDYTRWHEPSEEVDELAKTLSILDGDDPEPESPVLNVQKLQRKDEKLVKVNRTTIKPVVRKEKAKKTQEIDKSSGEPEDDEDESDFSLEDDGEELHEDDSDYEVEDTRQTRSRQSKRVVVRKTKAKPPPPPKLPTTIATTRIKILKPEVGNKSSKTSEVSPIQTPVTPTTPTTPEAKTPQQDKKPVKKEKRIPKNIPDDFALFSTPDIIRRVGKDKESPDNTQGVLQRPAKVDVRSKSFTELSPSSSINKHRLSLDGKSAPKPAVSSIPKITEKKPEVKFRKPSLEAPSSPTKKPDSPTKPNQPQNPQFLPEISTAEELNAMIDAEVGDQSSLNIDGTGLDLDPTLLENINNDLISEDILYQVAQSLVSNPELQNAIDKSINEGNLVLDSSLSDSLDKVVEDQSIIEADSGAASSSEIASRGLQIVRPDGRIVVIPPIERPTTRSRIRREQQEKTKKVTTKPLDEQHVSGNELDTTGDEEDDDEEESEDDPNKLWCICNQPHNNRFMICCDTCEEWYHGKCVNITKAMGQQMETEGREWICLFCKDPHLKRPQAAARRIRRASRHSRQSSESGGGSVKAQETRIPTQMKRSQPETGSASVPCVVCQKAARKNSIFCSESCILTHAQGVEKVVVFERTTGNMLTGNRAPSAANLEQWLKDHPGYEVVRSAGKIVTTKQTQNLTQSRLKIIKNPDNNGVSLAVQKKGVSVGIIKHLPKGPPPLVKTPIKSPGYKIISKSVVSPSPKSKPSPGPSTSTPVKKSVLPTVTAGSSKEKAAVIKTPKARQAEQAGQPKQAENIRENVEKTVFEQLTKRLKMVEDIKLEPDEVKAISREVESQLYKCFGDTGQKYRNKYRSLIFNIKDVKNQTLWRRICDRSISPYQLVRLSPDDMASQELALWREREAKHQLDMIKKSELELLNCSRTYVMKTHKGEEILEDNRPTDKIDHSEVITSLTENAPGDAAQQNQKPKRDSSKERDKKGSKHSHREKERKSSKEKSGSEHSHRSSSKDRDRGRKRSRSRDRSKHSEKKRSRSREREKHKDRKSTHKSSRHKKEQPKIVSGEKLDKKSKEILEQLVDNKIVAPLEDQAWEMEADTVPNSTAESDSDHEPTSTVTIPTPPRSSTETDEYQLPNPKMEVKEETKKLEPSVKVTSPAPLSGKLWTGKVNMTEVAQISITAHAVSGDCKGLGNELPPVLEIVGRISPDTVWDYIGKMRCSNSKIISLIRLEALNEEEKMPYLGLYGYLSSRNRLGVVKSTNKAVKDIYILPLPTQTPIPQALLPITSPGFEDPRPVLLLGVVVRDVNKRKRSAAAAAAATDSSGVIMVTLKKPKVEASSSARSYTPPPAKESKASLPLPPAIPDEDDDEPYSPEDSDPDNVTMDVPESSSSTSFLESVASAQTFQPFSNKFEDIPGLDTPTLPSSALEIQRQMERLNKQIEMQKSEINSISQNIAATASTEIGSSALANIALPSNLQQILDSIKTIGAANTEPTFEPPVTTEAGSTDLTIPLMIPTSFTRPVASSSAADTIPLNLPSKKKSGESDKSASSVLGSLSEEDLIRKAAEMLGEASVAEDSAASSSNANNKSSYAYSPTSSDIGLAFKKAKLDLSLPPVPGLEPGN